MTTEIQKIHKGEITLNDVQDKIIAIQNRNVLLDSDVAWLYGVDTNDVNQAVKRNPEKFPEGYIISLTESEKKEVATICGNPKIKFSPTLPNAFTEKGLYMLATILNVRSQCVYIVWLSDCSGYQNFYFWQLNSADGKR